MDQVVVIPTLNPTGNLFALVESLQRVGFYNIMVVDDGSDSKRQYVFCRLQDRDVVVLHHDRNYGKGAALKTAMRRIPEFFPDARAFVTVDDDGQHLPADVRQVCLQQQRRPHDMALGTRNLRSRSVPARSRFGNGFSALYFKADTGMTCHDTQTGLRCIPVSLIPWLLTVEGERYEYEMNFLTQAVKRGTTPQLVPITTVYLNGNRDSHFDTVRDSLRIYRSFLRFTLASLSCAAVDLGLFALLASVLGLGIAALVVVATLVARISSGVLNFTLNRHWSFRAACTDAADAAEGVRAQGVRYGALFAMQMLLSMMLVVLLAALPVPLVVTKMFVDTALFVVSYFVQRNWVFRAPAYSEAEREEHDIHSRACQAVASQPPVSLGMHLRGGARSVYRIRAIGYLRHPQDADGGRGRRYQQLGGIRHSGVRF